MIIEKNWLRNCNAFGLLNMFSISFCLTDMAAFFRKKVHCLFCFSRRQSQITELHNIATIVHGACSPVKFGWVAVNDTNIESHCSLSISDVKPLKKKQETTRGRERINYARRRVTVRVTYMTT